MTTDSGLKDVEVSKGSFPAENLVKIAMGKYITSQIEDITEKCLIKLSEEEKLLINSQDTQIIFTNFNVPHVMIFLT